MSQGHIVDTLLRVIFRSNESLICNLSNSSFLLLVEATLKRENSPCSYAEYYIIPCLFWTEDGKLKAATSSPFVSSALPSIFQGNKLFRAVECTNPFTIHDERNWAEFTIRRILEIGLELQHDQYSLESISLPWTDRRIAYVVDGVPRHVGDNIYKINVDTRR